MIALIIGGSGSGKSELAEQLCVTLDTNQKLYIATMYPWDEESRLRIEKHRHMRALKKFDTLECFYQLRDGLLRYNAKQRKQVERFEQMKQRKQVEQFEHMGKCEQMGQFGQITPRDHTIQRKRTVLLDCMSNLVANEMYCTEGIANRSEKGTMDLEQESAVVQEIMAGVRTMASEFENAILVSNDVFLDGEEYDESMQEYLNNLGRINELTARKADIVVEVVCGIPIVHKGAEYYEELME